MNSIYLLPESSQVHVWAIWLNAPESVSRAYRGFLSPEQIAHADKFAFKNLSRSYELSQGALRVLLSRYVGCHPRDLEFSFGPRGKPGLRGDSRVRFNMSHSGGLALFALTANCEIGVDVEEVRSISDIERIACHFFCQAEALELMSIPSAKIREEAFFRCWTRKEAYIKAVGDGLYAPLNKFQVTLLCDDPARFVHIDNDPQAAAGWTLQHLNPAPTYIGALAYQASAREVAFHEPLEAQQLLDGAH
jgi:4'-phosphopantetheinyl transferase